MVYPQKSFIDNWRVNYETEEITSDMAPVQFDNINKMLNSFTKFGRKRCPLCGENRKTEYYPEIPGGIYDDNVEHPEVHGKSPFCSFCLNEYVEHLKKMEGNNFTRAIYMLCALTGVYFDYNLALKIQMDTDKKYDSGVDVPDDAGEADLYMRMAMQSHPDKTFFASSNYMCDVVIKGQEAEEKGEPAPDVEKYPDELYIKNRNTVITNFHRDPFADEPIEDRRQLYEDAITMITSDIGENLPKARAVLEVVKGYNRIDKINSTLSELQRTAQSMIDNEKSIKLLVDQKAKELTSISTLCRDYELSDKYSKGDAKGIGTISAVVREISDKNFDAGRVNKFDIATAKAMQQVANISMESIFDQLKFTEADFSQIVRTQAKVIKDMQATMQAQSEELRLLKVAHLKQELAESYSNELKDRGIDPNDIKSIVKQQLTYEPFNFNGHYGINKGIKVIDPKDIKDGLEGKETVPEYVPDPDPTHEELKELDSYASEFKEVEKGNEAELQPEPEPEKKEIDLDKIFNDVKKNKGKSTGKPAKKQKNAGILKIAEGKLK